MITGSLGTTDPSGKGPVRGGQCSSCRPLREAALAPEDPQRRSHLAPSSDRL
jgi:hypothetical protein